MKKPHELIDSYKDFPKKGIDFKDVPGIIQEPMVFRELILKMSASEIVENAEAIISIDAKALIYRSASLCMLQNLWLWKENRANFKELHDEKYNFRNGENFLKIKLYLNSILI